MKQIDVAIAVLQRGGLILIAQRGPHRTFPGVWEFPGGKCEPGEAPAVTVARELLEELGVRAEPHTAMPIIAHDYPDFSVRLHPFICALLEGEPRPISAERLAWVEPSRLREYAFPPANESLIESIMQLTGSVWHNANENPPANPHE